MKYDNKPCFTNMCFRRENPGLQEQVAYSYLKIRLFKTDPKNLRITIQTNEEILDTREDDGRIVFETERVNESLPIGS
jgi:hypothetical protein